MLFIHVTRCLYMNKSLFSLFLIASLTLTGCSTIKGIFSKNATKEAKQANKIQLVEDKQTANLRAEMNQVGVLASGTDYALNKITNKEPPVAIAQDINKRVLSLAGTPNIEAEKEMWKIVDTLLIDKLQGITLLAKKDSEIDALQRKDKQLQTEWVREIDKYKSLAADTALKADALQQSMDKMNSWFGLGAIFYGLKRLIVSIAWILGIGSVIFLILRFASASNPIAASLFSVFSRIGSWVINTIEVIVPKALEKSGQVSKKIYDEMALVLKKIVDNIQSIKVIEQKTGKDITLKEVLVELDKSMDQAEKDIVNKIKKELGY